MRRALAWLVSWLSPEREAPGPKVFAARAEAFYRAGGVLLLSDLDALTDDQLVALAKAAERVRAYRSADLAAAVRSPVGEAALLAPYDGGSGLDRLRAEALLEAIPAEEVAHG